MIDIKIMNHLIELEKKLMLTIINMIKKIFINKEVKLTMIMNRV